MPRADKPKEMRSAAYSTATGVSTLIIRFRERTNRLLAAPRRWAVSQSTIQYQWQGQSLLDFDALPFPQFPAGSLHGVVNRPRQATQARDDLAVRHVE